jgi:hypothetical protein
MKIKIQKIKSAPTIAERLKGLGEFRITGPDIDGNRLTFTVYTTRQEAEALAKRVFTCS